MDNLIQTMITQLPNLCVAIYMLWRQQKTVDSLLDNQQKLIDRLLSYVDNDKQTAQQVISSAAQSANGK